MTKIRDDKYLKQLGEHLRKLREDKGYSQYKMADLANIPRSQIISIEKGEINTTISSLKAIAEAHGITVSALIDF